MNEPTPIDKNKKKRRSLKQWASDHQEVLAVGTVYAGVIGAFAYLIHAANKDLEEANQVAREEFKKYVERVETRNEFINERQNAGEDVYYLADERILTIDPDGKHQTHII